MVQPLPPPPTTVLEEVLTKYFVTSVLEGVFTIYLSFDVWCPPTPIKRIRIPEIRTPRDNLLLFQKIYIKIQIGLTTQVVCVGFDQIFLFTKFT